MSSARRSADTGPRVCSNRDSPTAALRAAIRLNPSMYPPMMPSNNSSDWTAGPRRDQQSCLPSSPFLM